MKDRTIVEQSRPVIRNENGHVLVLTLLILFAIAVISTAMTGLTSTDLKIAGNNRARANALYVAEAGLNEAIHRMSVANPTVETVGGWTGNIAIGDSLPLDPNWEARIYLTAPDGAPASTGSLYNTGTLQDPGEGYLEYSSPSGAAGVISIRHKWVDRDSDGIRDADEIVRYDPTQIPPENFMSGLPIDVITVTGKQGATSRTLEAEVTKQPMTARVLGAVYVNGKVGIKGLYGFCGYNHSLSTPEGLVPNGCNPYHTGSGDLPAIAGTGFGVKFEDGEIAGSPVPIDNDTLNPWYPLHDLLGISAAELNDILSNADHTSVSASMHGITYINGDAVINSSTEGSGLMYVTGHLDINPGPLVYRGLIYCEGKMNIKSGSWILGALCGGESDKWQSKIDMSGILYSADAISLAGQFMPTIVLSWGEK